MSEREESALREAICAVCRKLWERGLVAGGDGNVSARLGPDRVLATPAGFSKVDVAPDDLVVVSGDGRKLNGEHAVSTEIGVHLRAYLRRPDVHAVVHAHPPTATGLAATGQTIPDDVFPEATVLLGPVPLVRYATPGTPALADAFEEHWSGHDAFLMANHGALTLGGSLRVAHQRMESLEHTARILAAARAFGSVQSLAPHEVLALREMRARLH